MNTDIKKLASMAEDTINHKKLVLDNCYLLFKYLVENNKLQLGIDLLKRGATHDNSKFEASEFSGLAKILKGKDCFTNADYKLTPDEIKAIENHWKKNRHHPEYFSYSSEMSELDMIEMVCDWFARSRQYGTEFIPFVIERQKNRFHFEDKQFQFILEYCYLIEGLYKTSLGVE